MHMEGFVTRIHFGRPFQKLLTLAGAAGGEVDHRRMEKQVCILHAGRERLLDFVEGFGDPARAIQRPGQRFQGDNMTDINFSTGDALTQK